MPEPQSTVKRKMPALRAIYAFEAPPRKVISRVSQTIREPHRAVNRTADVELEGFIATLAALKLRERETGEGERGVTGGRGAPRRALSRQFTMWLIKLERTQPPRTKTGN